MGQPDKIAQCIRIQSINKVFKVLEMLCHNLCHKINLKAFPRIYLRCRPIQKLYRVAGEITLFIIKGQTAVLEYLLLVAGAHIILQIHIIIQ